MTLWNISFVVICLFLYNFECRKELEIFLCIMHDHGFPSKGNAYRNYKKVGVLPIWKVKS